MISEVGIIDLGSPYSAISPMIQTLNEPEAASRRVADTACGGWPSCAAPTAPQEAPARVRSLSAPRPRKSSV